jgi:hypothetical protein
MAPSATLKKPQASTGHVQTYPSESRQVEATTINHVLPGTVLQHVANVAICRTPTIQLKTEISKKQL